MSTCCKFKNNGSANWIFLEMFQFKAYIENCGCWLTICGATTLVNRVDVFDVREWIKILITLPDAKFDWSIPEILVLKRLSLCCNLCTKFYYYKMNMRRWVEVTSSWMELTEPNLFLRKIIAVANIDVLWLSFSGGLLETNEDDYDNELFGVVISNEVDGSKFILYEKFVFLLQTSLAFVHGTLFCCEWIAQRFHIKYTAMI